MNPSVIYEIFDKMHTACSRIHPIAADMVYDKEMMCVYKLPGKKVINKYNTENII